MELFSIKLPLIKENDKLLKIIIEIIKKQEESLKEGDIIVIAEKGAVLGTADKWVARSYLS